MKLPEKKKPSGSGNSSTGLRGEEIAAAFLENLGFKLLECNYRCKCGEIDIIAADPGDDCLVFVEVKTRRSLAYGSPQLAVTAFKQRQITRAALTWLSQNRKHDRNARFDVIAILLHNRTHDTIEHIKNAFELSF